MLDLLLGGSSEAADSEGEQQGAGGGTPKGRDTLAALAHARPAYGRGWD
jgi:hypothetical protein